jgi:hypothetical protein
MKNIEIILMLIASIGGLVYLLLNKNYNKLNIVIIGVQIITILFSIIGCPSICFLCYGISLLLAVIYPYLHKSKLKFTHKLLLHIFYIPVILTYVFSYLHYLGYLIIITSLIVSVIIFIYTLIKWKKFISEIALMFFYVTDALIRIILFIV